MIRLLIACVLLSVATGANAQMMNHFGMIPDFKAAYPEDRVVIVPAGETIAMPSGDIDLLWIEGVCVAPKNADLELKVREIVVAPGGHLDMGTEADPVLGKVTITFADGDFTGDDPTQWGHGLLVFGNWNACGTDKPIWSEGGGSGEPIAMNANALSVMGQIFVDSDNTITFNSENPAGTRGHIIVSDDAECMVKNVSLVGLGRTKPEPLSASNLIGRYPLHFHHSTGASRIVKNVFCDGLDYRSKWGIVVHHSSWVTVEGCVVTRTAGGFITEDGSEVANKFIGNLAYENKAPSNASPKTSVKEGFRGAGFWFKSMAQFIDDNVSINNHFGIQSTITNPEVRGVPDPGQQTSVPQWSYQSSPGGPMDGVITVFQSTLSGKRNRFVANRDSGFDCWGSVPQLFSPQIPGWWELHALPCQWEECLFAWNGMEFGGRQVMHPTNQSCMIYTNCDFVCDRGYGSVSAIDYHRVLYFDGCRFEGMEYGAMTGRGAIFQNNIFNCDVGIVADRLSSQNWPFGMTISDNSYSGLDIEYRGTERTIDDIPYHEVTLAQVYQNIDDFRNRIGVVDDPNESERARLQAEIDSVNQQIAALMLLLADLEAQLQAL